MVRLALALTVDRSALHRSFSGGLDVAARRRGAAAVLARLGRLRRRAAPRHRRRGRGRRAGACSRPGHVVVRRHRSDARKDRHDPDRRRPGRLPHAPRRDLRCQGRRQSPKALRSGPPARAAKANGRSLRPSRRSHVGRLQTGTSIRDTASRLARSRRLRLRRAPPPTRALRRGHRSSRVDAGDTRRLPSPQRRRHGPPATSPAAAAEPSSVPVVATLTGRRLLRRSRQSFARSATTARPPRCCALATRSEPARAVVRPRPPASRRARATRRGSGRLPAEVRARHRAVAWPSTRSACRRGSGSELDRAPAPRRPARRTRRSPSSRVSSTLRDARRPRRRASPSLGPREPPLGASAAKAGSGRLARLVGIAPGRRSCACRRGLSAGAPP